MTEAQRSAGITQTEADEHRILGAIIIEPERAAAIIAAGVPAEAIGEPGTATREIAVIAFRDALAGHVDPDDLADEVARRHRDIDPDMIIRWLNHFMTMGQLAIDTGQLSFSVRSTAARKVEADERSRRAFLLGDIAALVDREANRDTDPAGIIDAATEVLRAHEPETSTDNQVEPAEALIHRIGRMKSGELSPIPVPWPVLDRVAHPIMPGTICVLTAPPGSGKSFLVIQAVRHWVTEGVPVAAYLLEDDRETHLARALAQHMSNGVYADAHYTSENPDDVAEVASIHAEYLNAVGRSLWVIPDEPPTLDDLLAWAHERAEAGARVLVIDPISAATSGGKPWIEDQRTVLALQRIARDYSVAVLVTTHPRKGSGGGYSLDDVAGGAAFSRFVSTVLWLSVHRPPEMHSIRVGVGLECVTHERTMHILKNRHGRGAGIDLAMSLRVDARMHELGQIDTGDVTG